MSTSFRNVLRMLRTSRPQEGKMDCATVDIASPNTAKKEYILHKSKNQPKWTGKRTRCTLV
eukprot:scaffold4958_cov406-Prasinococcus_capsulatus_cf.AAC.2